MLAEGLSLEELEGRIGKLLKQMGRDLLRQAFQQMEVVLVELVPEVYRVKKRSLHLLTLFG